MLKSKNLCRIVNETFKTVKTNPQGFFDLSNFYFIIDFGPSDLEAAVLLQIEVKWKMLGWSFTFGVRSVKNCCQKRYLKNLTTPNVSLSFYGCPDLASIGVQKYLTKYFGRKLSSWRWNWAMFHVCGSSVFNYITSF